MHTRILAIPMAVVFIFLLACQNKEKPPEQTTSQEQTLAAPAPDTSASDTAGATLANGDVAQAERFAENARYDSAIVYFERASALYKEQASWEKYASCQNKISEQFKEKGEYQQAQKHAEQALEIGLVQLGERHLEVARSYYHLGHVYRLFSQLDQALDFQQKALSIRLARLGEQHPEVALSYLRLGQVYLYKGDFKRALALYEKTLSIQLATSGEKHPEVARTYLGLGAIFLNQGDYQRAFDFYGKSLSIALATRGERHIQVADICIEMSTAYMMKRDLRKCLEYSQRALPIILNQFGEKSVYAADCYRNIGVAYDVKGDYDQAGIFHEKALSIYTAVSGEKTHEVASVYMNLGLVYSSKGDYDRALFCFRKGLSIGSAIWGERHGLVSQCYMEIGRTYRLKREYDQALRAFAKALAIARVALGEQHPGFAEVLTELGEVHYSKGDYDRSLAVYKKALAVQEAKLGKLHRSLAITHNRIARAYYQKGNYDRSLDFLQQALAANVISFDSRDPYVNPPWRDIVDEGILLNSLAMKADALFDRYDKQSGDLRDLKASLAASELGAHLIDHMRRGYTVEGARLALAERTTGYYDAGIQIALRLCQAARANEYNATAFWFAEKGKAGAVLDALSELEAKAFAGIPDSLLEQERQWRLDLAFYEQRFLQEKIKGKNADSAQIALWQDRVFGLKQAYDALLQRFDKEYPDYYNLKYQIKTVSVPEIQQQLLDDKTALVEYFTGKDSLYIFAVTKNDFTVKASAGDSLLAREIEQLRYGIIKQDFAPYAQAASRLYQALLAPVAGKLRGRNLIIVPDAALSAIPFEALLTHAVSTADEWQDYAKLPYVINEYAVSYAYSATLLQQEQNRRSRETRHDYLAFAPVFANGLPAGTRGADFFKENFAPDSSKTATASATATVSAPATRVRGYLPATKKEVTGILDRFKNSYNIFERWFGNKSKVYLEREAKEEKLKSRDLSDYRFLHFATHGLVNEKSPKLSGLLLASEDSTSKEDGILHLGEIYNLNLNADLVVLSACETGLGQVAKGEGIIGLTRGFLYAGASNLLVSLWQVSDVTTADLMVDFYDKMLGGMSKPEAVREAKLQMIRRHAEYAKPYYWAPFILVGK